MSYPLPPGGLFPLTTAPTGRTAGGAYPLPSVLVDAIKSLNPTAYWKLDEASGDLADAMSGGYTATVTGSPTYGVAAPSPIGRGVTWSGTEQYAVASASVPTPTTGITLVAAFRTSSTTAAEHRIAARIAASQFSWRLGLGASHDLQWFVFQSGGTAHAGASIAAVNDGAWHLAVGRFDGTTLNLTMDSTMASSTSLAGTWHTTSTATVGVAASGAGSSPFAGDLAHVAIINQDIGAAATSWLVSIAKGG